MKKIIIFLPVVFLALLLSCCEKGKNGEPRVITIALSKGAPVNSYANYYNWIKSFDSTVICQDLYDMPMDSALIIFRGFSGLILTGGTDINPILYEDTVNACRSIDIDDYQDSLEVRLIDSALAWGMPILGICRGHQILNVALGGSLIKDIPTEFDTTVAHRCSNYQNCFHNITIETGSLLNEITGLLSGTVNSNHHQGVKLLAPPLRIGCRTQDELPESVEWSDPEGKSFLLGVQWHPERLGNDNPLAGKIGERFLEECRQFAGRSSQVAVRNH
ncbi:MAG: gamma-glutamyl-gamma-aminobutyrate hydrolase family protein [Bacteroidales bacterium]|jgi:putative glutamine amidotransferase|nr:gamma-glutamyl-gamma-aminobutyrate hydrolase family protein [Bacteroidales bacterium]